MERSKASRQIRELLRSQEGGVLDEPLISTEVADGEGPSMSAAARWRKVGAVVGTGTALMHQVRRRTLESVVSHDGGESDGPTTFLEGLRSDVNALATLLFGSWINVILVCLPLGFISGNYDWNPIATFTLNFIGIVPLALLLGEVTEDLALRFGETIGGLINATFGNVVEMVLSCAALYKGLYEVVALSLVGSVLSNLLLVLGCCFLFGGMKYSTQTFNKLSNRACHSLLFLSVIMVIFPAGAHLVEATDTQVLALSRGTAIIMASMYGFYLLFQLKTHSDAFQADEEEETPALSLPASTLALAAITALVAVASEFLTGSIEAMSDSSGISKLFLSVIVLPIAGNACEHATAVLVAVRGKMDLALGVAVGSSVQISMFVIPFIVLFGWATGTPGHGSDFSMNIAYFDPFGVLALVVAVLHANTIMSDGESHWLMGVQLLATYAVVGLAFFFRNDDM